MAVQIVVAGSCNIDQIVYAPRLPFAGETIHGHRYEVGFGGKGANQCVAAAKLGARTAMIAKVGEDPNGEAYLKNLQCVGIDISHVMSTADACTGVAPIIVGDDGNNSIVIVSGANMLLSNEDIDKSLGLIANSKILLCQLEIDVKTTIHALKMAHESGIITILNPAPAVSDLAEEIYKYCDVLCPNETEATLLTGVEVDDVPSAKIAVKKLLEKGCKSCVLTLGKVGCVYGKLDMVEPQHIRSRAVKAVDTTGAGDSFIGALAYFMCNFENLSMVELLARSCWVAADSVCRKGTQKSYPQKNDLPADLFQMDAKYYQVD